MRPVSYVLLALLLLAIGAEVWFTVRPKRVRFLRVRSEFLPEGFLQAVCPQAGEPGLPAPDREAPDRTSRAEDYFQEIAEKADPNAPDQAVLYVEDSNIILVSAGIVARIAGGDRRLVRRIARWTEDIKDAYVVVANFGLFKRSNS